MQQQRAENESKRVYTKLKRIKRLNNYDYYYYQNFIVKGKDDEVCTKPKIIDPPICKQIRPGDYFEMVVSAEAGDPSKP